MKNRGGKTGGWSIMAICAAACVLLGCEGGGSSGGGPVDSALVGSWRLSSMRVNGSGSFSPSEIGWDVRMTLNSDGSLSYTEVWEGETEGGGGSWSAEGGIVHLDGDSFGWNGPYSVSGNKFTGAFPNYDGEGHNGDLTFTRL